MAVLSDQDRVTVWSAFMRWWSTDGEPATIDKPALRAAVDAADAWVDSNAASFNSALPVAARTRLSARQKAKVLLAVIERRFGVS